jgi:enterochelin esterase-like enzyme
VDTSRKPFYHRTGQIATIALTTLIVCIVIAACQPVATPTVQTTKEPTKATFTPLPTLTPPSPSSVPLPATPEGECIQEGGQVLSQQYSGALYPKPIDFRLYLPPCYNPDHPGGYPMLLLFHGQDADDNQWQRLGVAQAADRLIAGGEAVPFIIVMPGEEYYLQDPVESTFGTAVIEGLLPWVENNYSVCAGRACRAIGGLSRGATWAVRLGLTQWPQFSAIGAHSLTYTFISMPQWVHAIPQDEMPRIYLDAGSQDGNWGTAAQLHDTLTYLKVAHEWHINPGGHDEAYWRTHVEDYLRWYAGGWSPP